MTRSLYVPLAGLAALVAVVVIVGGRNEPATAFERIVAQPDRYVGERVRVTGWVHSRTRRPGTFTLAGPGGGMLLVFPSSVDDVPAVSRGLRVSIQGEVVGLRPFADELAGDGPGDPVALGDLATRLDAVALLQADEVDVRAGY